MNSLKKVTVYGVSGLIVLSAGWFLNEIVNDRNEVNYEVELKTKNDGVLEVKKDNQCEKKPHKGCLLFEEDKTGVIKFYLSGSRINSKKCPKADAVITKIELTTMVDETVEDDSKGEFSGDLDSWIKDFAFPDVDEETGVVYEAPLAIARSQAWLINLNSHDASDGEKHFWYRVTATGCGESHTTWVTDPRGDNKGSN